MRPVRQGKRWKLYMLEPGDYFQDGYVEDGYFGDNEMASVMLSFLTEVEDTLSVDSQVEDAIEFNVFLRR